MRDEDLTLHFKLAMCDPKMNFYKNFHKKISTKLVGNPLNIYSILKPPPGAGCGEPVGLQGALPQRKELHLQVYRLSTLHGDCTRGPGDFTRGLYQGTDCTRRRRTLWRSGIAATSVADPNQDLFFPGSRSESGDKSSIRIRGSDMDPNPAQKCSKYEGNLSNMCVYVYVGVYGCGCGCVCVCYMHQKIRLNASLGLSVSFIPSVLVLYRILKIIYFFFLFVI